jgi:outer membrane protein OmpA-like peptidoglycan-associated protein
MTFSKTSLTVLSLFSACASVAPAQLVDARDAYAASSTGLAAKLTPTELYDAKKVLDRANHEYEEYGDTQAVRDYAYIASRKIELADVKARTEVDRQHIAEAMRLGVVVRDDQVKRSQSALADTREQLQGERDANLRTSTSLLAANAAQGVELQQSVDRLNAEKAARNTSEAKLASAMRDLATVAALREDARGVIITLSGSVLFASGKFALLETARARLDQVAEALKSQGDDKQMVVEGHTDSQGSDAFNQVLARNRATSVRDYLVSKGVDAAKISSVGMGSSRPLLDNANAENRANNRRVEIVIRPAPVSER